MPNTSRYSHHARRALTHADLLVKRLRHPYADTGHLLVGVMLTSGSIGHRILTGMALSAEQAEPHLRALYPITEIPGEETGYPDALEMTLALAESESEWLSHHYIGTEHLLLGITRANAGNASQLLRRMGTSSENLRSRVRRALSEGGSEDDLLAAKHMARLSELSRRAINAAEQQAVTLDHPTVGIGHLLLVLAQENRSPVAAKLRHSGFDENSLRQRLAAGDPVMLTGIETILNRVRDLVVSMGSHYTGTEHLLLALLAAPEGSVALNACGVDLERLKHHLQSK